MSEYDPTAPTVERQDRNEEVPEKKVFLVFYHRSGTKIAPLFPGEEVVVGRTPPADVEISDPSLSRQHASFFWEGDEISIIDLGSTNGTLVNGRKIGAAKINPGDEVTLGAVTVMVHIYMPRDHQLLLDSHDSFMAKLDLEVMRAKTFQRTLTVIMVRAGRHKNAHLSHWCHRVKGLLRPIDLVALYAPNSLLIARVEANYEDSLSLLDAIVKERNSEEPPLYCGVSVYPEDAGSPEELIEAARTGSQNASSSAPFRLVPSQATHRPGFSPVVVSPKMAEMYKTVSRIANSQAPILIQGETGTGKEVVARAIHERGSRRDKPLHCVNCGAIPAQLIESVLFGHEKGVFTGAHQQRKGLFEQTQGGTILLDEVGELSMAAQTALLRVIENRQITRLGSVTEIEVDVRIIAATHRNLELMCEEGSFRWDLYYRLNTLTVSIPPLRERREEILPLIYYFITESNRANKMQVERIDPGAQQLLMRYNWPGNVRELRNVIERAVLISQDNVIISDDLSERVRQGLEPGINRALKNTGEIDIKELSIKEKLRRYESQLFIEALRANGWNQSETSRALGIPLRTLVHKLKTYGIRKKYEE